MQSKFSNLWESKGVKFNQVSLMHLVKTKILTKFSLQIFITSSRFVIFICSTEQMEITYFIEIMLLKNFISKVKV